MSSQRLREKNAKVEGRDPPEPKETVAPFRTLTARLLKVSMGEVKEQQRMYDDAQRRDVESPMARKKPRSKLKPPPIDNNPCDDRNKTG